MHTVFALLCFVVVIHWLIFPYPSGLLHWHCGNLTIAPVPAKQPWWIWINTSCEFIMNDCITTTKQSTTKPCAYFLGYTVSRTMCLDYILMRFVVVSYWLDIPIFFRFNSWTLGLWYNCLSACDATHEVQSIEVGVICSFHLNLRSNLVLQKSSLNFWHQSKSQI